MASVMAPSILRLTRRPKNMEYLQIVNWKVTHARAVAAIRVAGGRLPWRFGAGGALPGVQPRLVASARVVCAVHVA